MPRTRNYPQAGSIVAGYKSTFEQKLSTIGTNYNFKNYNSSGSYTRANNYDYSKYIRDLGHHFNYINYENAPSLKRRKSSVSTWEDSGRYHQPSFCNDVPSICDNNLCPPAPAPAKPCDNANKGTSNKRDRSIFEDDDAVFMSRHEIERCSPSRKDGIDALQEAHLRYSYCAFLQNLGLRLDLPQTTIGTSMVLCHRFFVRRSHACHDRFLIATAALFLAAKSEETIRPLNDVVRASSEILHKQDITILSYMLPIDWFEKYRERVIAAENLLLTTLDFELNVQHPYAPLTSMLAKLGLSQSSLVNLALNLISEGIELLSWVYNTQMKGLPSFVFNVEIADAAYLVVRSNRLRSSLWLQFKPHQIAAGAAFLAAKYLNMDLSPYRNVWMEFQTPPFVVEDIAQQLQELL